MGDIALCKSRFDTLYVYIIVWQQYNILIIQKTGITENREFIYYYLLSLPYHDNNINYDFCSLYELLWPH